MLLIQNAKTLGKYLGKGINSDELFTVNVLIENNLIKTISTALIAGKFDEVINAGGCFLTPGLIDPQVHFREPGGEKKETLETGGRSASRGGFTTVVTMPNTSPTTDNVQVVRDIISKSKELGLVRVLPTGAVTMGLKGEILTDFQALKDAGIIALTDDGKGIQNDEVMFQAMEKAAKYNLAILDHSEDESLSNKGAIHEGEISKKYNVPGIKSESEAVHVKRGCDYSLKTGCHYHVLHISTALSLKYVKEAKAQGANVTCEVSPHHLLLCDEDIKVNDGKLDANFKMNPPLRSAQDREECQKSFINGLIDVIATDHAPHTEDEKSQDITIAPFGIVGLETSFPLLYTNFVKTKKLSLTKLVDMMTIEPAKLFNTKFGQFAEGELADLALFDLENEIEIKAKSFHSKGKNTPFDGWKCFGKPVCTILEGKVVYQAL
ncbi:MAG: dihydroorotase [Thermoproteota archaeon]|jgi:dihydroorotase